MPWNSINIRCEQVHFCSYLDLRASKMQQMLGTNFVNQKQTHLYYF